MYIFREILRKQQTSTDESYEKKTAKICKESCENGKWIKWKRQFLVDECTVPPAVNCKMKCHEATNWKQAVIFSRRI